MVLQPEINSYVSMAEADEYFDGRLYADAWDESDHKNRERALISAARNLGRLRYRGYPVVAEQPLAFPRILSDDPPEDAAIWWYSKNPGYLYIPPSATGIPKEVKQAQCEEALALLSFGNSHRIQLQKQGIESISIDDVQETFERAAGKQRVLSVEARQVLAPYLQKSVRIQ